MFVWTAFVLDLFLLLLFLRRACWLACGDGQLVMIWAGSTQTRASKAWRVAGPDSLNHVVKCRGVLNGSHLAAPIRSSLLVVSSTLGCAVLVAVRRWCFSASQRPASHCASIIPPMAQDFVSNPSRILSPSSKSHTSHSTFSLLSCPSHTCSIFPNFSSTPSSIASATSLFLFSGCVFSRCVSWSPREQKTRRKKKILWWCFFLFPHSSCFSCNGDSSFTHPPPPPFLLQSLAPLDARWPA